MDLATYKTSLAADLTSHDAATVKSPAQLVREILGAVLDELTEGTNLFTGLMPTEPDSCVATYDSGGTEQDAKLAIDQGFVQIKARGVYAEAQKLLNKIKLVLQSPPDLTLAEGETVIGIWITSNVAFMGRDSHERSEFALNCRIEFQPTHLGNRM